MLVYNKDGREIDFPGICEERGFSKKSNNTLIKHATVPEEEVVGFLIVREGKSTAEKKIGAQLEIIPRRNDLRFLWRLFLEVECTPFVSSTQLANGSSKERVSRSFMGLAVSGL